MILGYLRQFYEKEPALINGALAALIAPVADAVGVNVPTNVLAGYVAVVLAAAFATRRKVTAPANVTVTDGVDKAPVAPPTPEVAATDGGQ